MTQKTQSPHRVIAERIKELRKARGWSAQTLADAMTKAGVPWDRSVVANFESGRRASVSLEEVFALAYVLDVAPVNLMTSTDLGAPPCGVVEGVVASADDVREWIRGRKPLGGQDVDTYFSKVAGSDFGFIYDALKRARGQDGER